MKNHLLENVPYHPTPNVHATRRIKPEVIVIHYTAGPSLQGAINTLTRKGSGVSAHVIVGRAGEVVQLAPFDRETWHAGLSTWKGRERVNGFGIGIELVNAGWLTPSAGGYKAWFGTVYPEATQAKHKNQTVLRYWHPYTDEQIEELARVCRIIRREYGDLEIVGHEDVSPGRKVDPGPAFPWIWFGDLVREPK